MPVDHGAATRIVLLVGCGKMGSALLRGWIANHAASQLLVVEPEGPPPGLADAPNVLWRRTPEELPETAAPEAVVFAVKPQILDDVLPSYRRWTHGQTLFVSIVAGKTIAGITRRLGEASLVRTMPNTPAAIGRSITVACANERVSVEQRRFCDELLAAVGESAWIEDEALLDAVTAVSGSGPAYVFLLIEALARAAEVLGLPPTLALRLARSTVAGSGELARLSSESPAQLRENVTSPGGTTRAALDILMADGGLTALIMRAVAAAAARSRELAS
ncbi:MAG: pyrroline-5-carboxylate reductase [Alphaproteobacteria bacterium]|nr:pyrroline-5-carboxylate reductase [Alphaproteobacteria bacterium]